MEQTVAGVGAGVGAILFLVLMVLGIILAVFWLIFPWMVYAQLKTLNMTLKRVDESQQVIQHILTKMERQASGTTDHDT